MLRSVGKSLKPRLRAQNGQFVAYSRLSSTNDEHTNVRKTTSSRANAGPVYTFGLRPPNKEAWKPGDPRFDKATTPRFGETVEVKELRIEALQTKESAPHMIGQEMTEEKLPYDAKPSILITNLRPETRKSHLLDLCLNSGLLLLDIELTTAQETTCKLRFDTAREAVKFIQYLEDGDFCKGPVDYTFMSSITGEITRFLTIRHYQDTAETLKNICQGQGTVSIHLIQAETLAGKRRVDAYLGFKDSTRATFAKRLLEKADFVGKQAISVRYILQEVYYNAVEQRGLDYTEGEISKPPIPDKTDTPQLPPVPRGPSSTIFLGNIPSELLRDKAAIAERFSAYGPLHDVRIPTDNGQSRGMLYLEFNRQEDADRLHHDLTISPLFLYNRKVRVDYAETKSRVKSVLSVSQETISDRGVCLNGVLPHVSKDRLELYRTMRAFGEIVDMRVLSLRDGVSPVFIDYLDVEGARAAIAAANSGQLHSLGPDLIIGPAGHPKEPPWINTEFPPTDVLRAWNIPVRALWTYDMLREALNFNDGLIHIRTPKFDGWPIGVAYLHYKHVAAAKEVLEWVTSDPEHPVKFFGRPLRIHFSNERPEARTAEIRRQGRDNSWGSRIRYGQDEEQSVQRSGLESWGQTPESLPMISNIKE